MASRRKFIARMRGKRGDGSGDERWERRSRTREAQVALAEAAGEITHLTDRRANGSGNGAPRPRRALGAAVTRSPPSPG